MSEKSVDLVLEGGGVEGIGLLGAVLTLADEGHRFERIAGASAGAIVAALVAAYQKDKRDLHELEDVMWDLDYASMAIPFYFRPVQVTTQNGTATWVDGGLLANFAITVFDRTDGITSRWPTWGVALSGQDTSGVSATDFDITEDDQTRLFTSGQRAATRFLENLPPDRLLE